MSLPPSQGLGKTYQDSPARGYGCPQILGGPGQCHQTLDLPVLSLQEREEAPELCWLPDPANDMPDQYLGCFALGAGPADAVRAALFTDNGCPRPPYSPRQPDCLLRITELSVYNDHTSSPLHTQSCSVICREGTVLPSDVIIAPLWEMSCCSKLSPAAFLQPRGGISLGLLTSLRCANGNQ